MIQADPPVRRMWVASVTLTTFMVSAVWHHRSHARRKPRLTSLALAATIAQNREVKRFHSGSTVD